MTRIGSVRWATFVLMLVFGCQLLHAQQRMPNVLIIGDSISIGYEPIVAGILAAEANVSRPRNENGGQLNCEGTTRGVEKIDQWLSAADWDVIHFNFGLHDLKHVHPETGRNSGNAEHPKQAELAQYEANLKTIVGKLKQTKAKLIFATTTPYPDKPSGPLRRAEDVAKYNAVALSIMKENGIAVNDLNGFVASRMDQLLLPNNVHFKVIGSRALAGQVADAIRNSLKASGLSTNRSYDQWEHLAVHSANANIGQDNALSQRIRQLGRQGWQLVDVVTVEKQGSTEKLIFFFKRPR